MLRYSLIVVGLMIGFGATPIARAQTANAGATSAPPEEQNETFRDTLVRMRIKREEDEHKKLVEKGTIIKDLTAKLTADAVGNSLPRAAEKSLREIEKSARYIRTQSGGGTDEPLEAPPANLADALKQLGEAGDKLTAKLDKTSRHVVSIPAVTDASEIIQLVKIMRGFIR